MPFFITSLVPRASETTIPIGAVDYSFTTPIVVATLLSITWILVCLRAFTRGYILRSFGWDDLFMVVALIFFSVFMVGWLNIHLIVNGQSSLTKQELNVSTSWLLVSESFYILTMLALKVALGMFFLRILQKQWQRRFVYAIIAISILYNAAYFFFSVFQCGIVSTSYILWQKFATGQCITPEQILAVSYTHAAITTATDMAYAILPITMVYQLHLERKEKIIVIFIIGMGAVGSIASLIRFRYIPKLQRTTLHFYSDAINIALWSSIELALGIAAGCLATMRPLFRNLANGSPSLRSPYQSRIPDTAKEDSYTARPRRRSSRGLPTLSSPLSTDKLRDDEEAYLPTRTSTADGDPPTWSVVSWNDPLPLTPLPTAIIHNEQLRWNEPAASTRRPSTAGSATQRRKVSLASQLQAVPIPTVELAPRTPITFNAKGMPITD